MTFKFNWKAVIPLIVLCILVLCITDYIFWPAKADDSSAGTIFSYGPNYNYSINVLPNNSYVHQGENISQGNYYDLSGIYGFSGVLGWWQDQWNPGTTYPDKTFDLNTLHLHNVYIDPATWPVGKYYQFDGMRYSDYTINGSYFGNGNCYMFYVVKPLNNWTAPEQIANVTKTGEIEVKIGENVTKVQVTYTEQVTQTAVPTSTIAGEHTIVVPAKTTEPVYSEATNVVDRYGNPVNNAPADIEMVTPKSPVLGAIPVIAACIAGLVLIAWKRRRT
jgi:hypothetical protein